GNDGNNGGGGGNPTVAVVVSPSAVTLAPGATRTFSASVTGTTNLGVTWTASAGTITTAGVYTAPSAVGTYTVRATSVANPGVSSVATVTVRSGVSQAVSLTPPNATVVIGATQQFTATATGFSNSAVTWTASGGTVSSTGLYTAPTVPGAYVVRATSVEDPSFGAEARITVTGAFSITSTGGNLGIGETRQFAATLPNGQTADVIWTASAGTISSTGLFTAPSGTGSVTITAALRSDPSQRATTTVTITQIAVAVTPSTATVARGESLDFNATVTGASSSSAVKWTASEGTIDANGLFTAPTTGTSTTVTITATSVANASVSGTATVTLTSALPNVTVTVSPTGAQVVPGGTYDFDASVIGTTSNSSVVWSTTTGSIDANGVLTAGSTAGTFEVRATSVANPNRFGTVTVKVDAIPIIIALNWLSVPLQWGFSFENLIQIHVPGSRGFTESVELASLLLTAFLSYRIIDMMVGGRALVTITSLLTLYVVPQLSQYEIAKVLSLIPDL
ncbi:hypothetical protein EON77_03275, partial [bacterium]